MFAIGIINILLISLLPRIVVPAFVIVMAVGVVTFFGWLAWCVQNSKSDKSDLNKGEIRKGIVGSFLMVYFAVLALMVFGEQVERSVEVPKIMDGFTQIIQIIVIFYFSSRTMEKWFETQKEMKSTDEKSDQSQTGKNKKNDKDTGGDNTNGATPNNP